MTPYEKVRSAFQFPMGLEERDYQIKAVNDLAPLPRSGWYAEVGTGKTFMATVVALYKFLLEGNACIVIMPPILLRQWHRWLTSIEGVTAVMYRGTPAQRKQIDLSAQFILMSIQVFKNDFEYLTHVFEHRKVTGIVDEATSIKNVGSQNYKRTRDFFEGRDLMLLTGTPLATPGDAYAYIKLVSPAVYRNQRHFEQLHVDERDFFDNVTHWSNLDFLAENMMLNSVRILKEKALPYLKHPIYVPIHYELDPVHYALYRKLANEQILLLPDGGKIDATTASKLYNCVQQIICNPGYFSGDTSMRSAAYELLDTILDEIGAGDHAHGGKLLVFSNYRMTNRGLVEYLKAYNAVACFSEVTPKQQEKNKDRFINDPACRVLLAQPMSGGYGIDGLQNVCSDVLFLETPVVPLHFNQGVGRVYRDGQKKPPTVRIAIAEGTIQPRLHGRLLMKDQLVNQVQGGWQDLREAIYGKV